MFFLPLGNLLQGNFMASSAKILAASAIEIMMPSKFPKRSYPEQPAQLQRLARIEY